MSSSPLITSPEPTEAVVQDLSREVEQLLIREQRRQALLLIPLAAGAGAAAVSQSFWLLAVTVLGLVLALLPYRRF